MVIGVLVVVSFNSFWDATPLCHIVEREDRNFQFLLGCYMQNSETLGRFMANLSIPFGMLPRRPSASKTGKMMTFNSFWDATVDENVEFVDDTDDFQFLLGCYKVNMSYKAEEVKTFNSFWDATA